MKVLVATKNQGKIEGARRALSKYYEDVEIQGIPVESNVPDQPVNIDVTETAFIMALTKYVNGESWK